MSQEDPDYDTALSHLDNARRAVEDGRYSDADDAVEKAEDIINDADEDAGSVGRFYEHYREFKDKVESSPYKYDYEHDLSRMRKFVEGMKR